MKRPTHRSPWLARRGWIQALSTVVLNLGFFRFLDPLKAAGGFCFPVLNCWACPGALTSCPIGALQHAAGEARLGIAGGESWLAVIPYYILGTLFVFSVTLGRFMCGWLCPFGWLQDLVGRVRRRKLRLPAWAGYLRYVFLVGLVLIVPYYTSVQWFSKLCPQGALQGGLLQPLLHPELRNGIGSWWSLKEAMLVGWLVAFLFLRRPFCRLMCPLGAIFSLFYGISMLQIRLDPYKCVDCGWCEKACPAGLKPREHVANRLCISCLECQACPHGAIAAVPVWRRGEVDRTVGMEEQVP
jgi:polyferredoxin